MPPGDWHAPLNPCYCVPRKLAGRCAASRYCQSTATMMKAGATRYILLGGRRMDTSLPGAQISTALNVSTIGEELTIDGNVTSKGEVRLLGQVKGDIHCVVLILAENAHLEGGVIAEEVTVRGRLIGPVRALSVKLQPGSHVEGRILSQESFC